MSLSNVFENNKKWIASKLDTDPKFFDKLAKGQNPDLLYIGCSDSRVTAEEMMGAQPGEAFVHRNIANMVNSLDMNVKSVINYAVSGLKVKYIVVCGHYGCGGIRAAMSHEDVGILNPWLSNIRDVYRIHQAQLGKIIDETERHNKLVELNVQEQIINVVKTSAVQEALSSKKLEIHGWVFDTGTGKLLDLNIKVEEILHGIREIYKMI